MVEPEVKRWKEERRQRRARWRARHRTETLAQARRYKMSRLGIAARLRHEHGYDPAAADDLANRLCDPGQRCAICGVPNWFVRVNHDSGGPFLMGNRRMNRRLTVDHVIPGGPSTLANTRILCFACNQRRGAARMSDTEVLRWVSRQLGLRFPRRLLFWLNTTPGAGGRLHRNVYVVRREEDLNGLVHSTKQEVTRK
jgi:hypothetical protein